MKEAARFSPSVPKHKTDGLSEVGSWSEKVDGFREAYTETLSHHLLVTTLSHEVHPIN